jgi:hypothetical protein
MKNERKIEERQEVTTAFKSKTCWVDRERSFYHKAFCELKIYISMKSVELLYFNY